MQGRAQKREWRTGVIQASKPPPESGWIGHVIGILDRRGGVFQRTVFAEVKLGCLTAGDEAVVSIGRRERRQDGKRLSAMIAFAAANADPIMIFVVGLFTAPAMADDGILETKRAAALQGDCVRIGPIRFEVVLRRRK